MAPIRSDLPANQKRSAAFGALLIAASATLSLTPSAANATIMTVSARPAAEAPAAESLLHRAATRDVAARNHAPASVSERRNILLTKPIITAGAHIPAGTRVSSYLVAISGAETGEMAFDTPVLAVIADETALAETSPYFGPESGPDLGKAKFNVAALSDFAPASPAAFTTSGNVMRYQLDNPSADPVIVRVITAAVPEPGTWAMLIAGFGLIGAMMRRQKRQILSA